MIQKSSFVHLGKSISLFLSYGLLLLLVSCNPMGDNKVEILTQGALDPVEFRVVGGEDQGEFLVGSDTRYFTLELKNNNRFEIFNVSLEVDPFSTAAMKFANNADGKSISPGFGGTCQSKVPAGTTCTFIIEFTPSFSGELSQNFKVTYSNLINTLTEEAKITLLAGEAASLSFIDDVVNYDYGYMERTEPQKITKKLTVVNNGGLTARNINFGVLYSHNSDAFLVKDNTCGESLAAGEQCTLIVDYLPQNYGPGAPDGNEEVTYTCNPRFDYIRDPEGGKGALTAYFTALSTTIEGRVLSSGINQIEYTELTVGNRETKTVKIQNYGYKEAIVHYVEVYDASDVKVATCIKIDGQNELVCQDPATTAVDGSALALADFPLRISDTSGCVNLYTELDYTRDELGNLSNPNLEMLAGKTNSAVGGSCFFDLTFWPSVTHQTNGNVNDYKLRIKFDSTWKNNITMYGEDNTSDYQFIFSDASWLSAAKIEVSEYKYGTSTDYTRETGTAENVFLYDLGRIALISNNAYKQGVKISFKNLGYTDAVVSSVTDGKATPNILTEDTSDLNPYYLSTGHVGCTVVNAIGGDCNIRFNLAPMASSLTGTAAQAEENGNMFDVLNTYPNQYKKFIINYKDGTTYNDDGSLRADRSVEVWSRALLVRKGFLVFSSTDSIQGTDKKMVGDSAVFHHVLLKNAGTGGIPVIEMVNGFDLAGASFKAAGLPYPYAIIDRPDVDGDADGFFDGEAGAEKDCYDLVVAQDAPLPFVTPGSNASSILDAGQSCSLTVKYQARGNDILPLVDYQSTTPVEWDRFFDSDYQNDHELWEEKYYSASSQQLTFRYYDGDGVSDAVNGYYPDEEGYGNYYQISGGTEGFYNIDGRILEPGRLIPVSPLPMVSSVICRDEINLPAYTVVAPEWGDDIAAETIPEVCRDFSVGKSSFPASNWSATANYVRTNNAGYDYIYHAGYFAAGSTYDLSFRVEERGNIGVTNATHSYTGDTSVLNWTNPWSNPISNYSNRNISLSFTPATDGLYSTDLVITYNNGETNLTDINTLAMSNQQVTFRIKIIAEALPTGVDNIALSVQDYAVTYDSATETVDDTGTKGSPYNIGLFQRTSDMTGNGTSFYAIRESAVYDKKVFTFTNNSGSALTNFQFNIKTSVNANGFGAPSGTGISIFENNCMNITLNAAASCTVTMHFQASKDEADSRTVYGAVVYGMGGIAFQMKNFIMDFGAGDPATLETLPKIATKIIKDPDNKNITSIPLNLGLYTDAGHPIVDSYPTDRFSKSNVRIANISSEKASFLAQWELFGGGAPLPGTTWVEIYNTNGISVEANRVCFFGDDEGAGIPEEEKGFNSTTAGACRLNLHIDLDDTYFGVELDTAFTNFKLRYYNNGRASYDEMIFHFTGFVEPNKSQMVDTSISNVNATNDGTLYLEWNTAEPANSSWGAITGYRVFYATTKNSLNNIYTATTYADTFDEFIEISGLIPGRYYYLKVVTLRQTPGGKEFISDITGSIKEVIIPPSGYFYDYDAQVLIARDKSSGGGPDLKDEGNAVCASDVVTVSENGVVKNKPMKLIDSAIWDIITSDDNNSDYDTDITPHWLSDNPVDISFLFPDFSCSETSGDDGASSFYTKDCSDCSCNSLSIVKGGDGMFLPPGSTIYVDGTAMSAFFRCYIDQ